MPSKPEISVIIPSLNEEGYIKNVFKGLSDQTFRNFEIIVVDGNSTDRTRDIARKHGRIILENRPHIGVARNTGARAAKGKILFFTNADTRASPGLLKIYSRLFEDKSIVAASGPLLPLEKTTMFIRFGYWFASVVLAKLSFLMGMPAISGSNLAVRRSAFNKMGGFDESLVTYEDLDLVARLKACGSVKYVDTARVETSARRIVKWGLIRYILFNAGNVLRYNLFHKSKENYEPIR
ncbi:MAG: glycosyltransferase [Candidatus Marsarchaeota archaeon]|nr:glycosyltransferase [Candidatus Marsarchaeota archaeon]MCL5413285.1 glycosyltransferase [Candidatus Marsarchaeota archaeon]